MRAHIIDDLRAVLRTSIATGVSIDAVRALFRAYEDNTRDIQRLHDLMDDKIEGMPKWKERPEDNRRELIASTMRSVLGRWEGLNGKSYADGN